MYDRQPITEADREAYRQRSQHGPCFVCELIAGNPDYRHHIIFEDEQAIVFLDKYPTLYGHTLVVPRQHREQVTGDFRVDEYLGLQRIVYRVSEALRLVVPTERMYILSLGSQQGNRHVHWHIAPLPSDVPYDEQQFAALQGDKGLVKLSEEELTTLAKQIRQAMEAVPDAHI